MTVRNVVIEESLGSIKRWGCCDYSPTLAAGEAQLAVESFAPLATLDRQYAKVSAGAIVEMTQAEQDAVDAARLPELKVAKSAAIDARTAELIAQGFAYDGEVFSLSLCAQSNLEGIYPVRNEAGVSWPIQWSTLDNAAVYSIPDAAAFEAFYFAALGTKRARLDSGNALKAQVAAAASKAEVDAVEDNR